MTQFYALEPIDHKIKTEYPDNEFIADDMHMGGIVGSCPKCQLGGRYDWLPPYSVEIEVYRKSVFIDVMFGTGITILACGNFKVLFEQSDLKGLVFRDKVAVTKVKCMAGAKKKLLPNIPDYYLTKPEKGTTAIDHEKSGSVFLIDGEPKCSYCRLGEIMRIQQLVVDESTWDGRDIFQINGIGRIITTQKFKDWFDANHFTGLRLIPAEEFSFDLYWGQTPEEWAESVRLRREREAVEKSTPPSTV